MSGLLGIKWVSLSLGLVLMSSACGSTTLNEPDIQASARRQGWDAKSAHLLTAAGEYRLIYRQRHVLSRNSEHCRDIDLVFDSVVPWPGMEDVQREVESYVDDNDGIHLTGGMCIPGCNVAWLVRSGDFLWGHASCISNSIEMDPGYVPDLGLERLWNVYLSWISKRAGSHLVRSEPGRD